MAAVETLAFWLALAVALIPILIALAVYVPPRVRFVRRAGAGRRFLDSAADLDLFALRAMTHQPLHVLARVSPDPAGAWRLRDRLGHPTGSPRSSCGTWVCAMPGSGGSLGPRPSAPPGGAAGA